MNNNTEVVSDLKPSDVSAYLGISECLGVNHTLSSEASLQAEIDLRVKFLRDKVLESGVASLVLGISGGVDSLTAGLLAVRAVKAIREQGGACQFIAMRLPYGSQADEDDAQKALKVIQPDQVRTSDIKPATDAMLSQTVQDIDPDDPAQDFVKGNIKARMRMIAQYSIANSCNGLVLGTDHAAEAVMGFFTKHGDGACDLAPLAGLTKGQVRQMAKLMGAPDELVYKKPTADLEDLDPGKADEDAYGCTYDEIDAFLLGNPISERAAQLILARYVATMHKRDLPYTP